MKSSARTRTPRTSIFVCWGLSCKRRISYISFHWGPPFGWRLKKAHKNTHFQGLPIVAPLEQNQSPASRNPTGLRQCGAHPLEQMESLPWKLALTSAGFLPVGKVRASFVGSRDYGGDYTQQNRDLFIAKQSQQVMHMCINKKCLLP